MKINQLFQTAARIAAALLLTAVIVSCNAQSKERPVILLRSGWQVENIGDVSHTPGFVATVEKYLPEADVIFWPYYGLLPDSEVEMLRKRFPQLTIVQGTLSENGGASSEALAEAIQKADIFIHNSGPSMLSWREAMLFKKMTGKPYGVYGVTYGLYGTPEKQALTEADFLYFRDTVSLERARQEGVACPVMEWAPDAAFGADVTDDEKALAFLKANGLEPGKFICCNPNQRRTPFWEHTFKNRPFDKGVNDLNERMREHDHAPMIEAIEQIVRQTDLKVLIVHEDETELAIGKTWIYDRLSKEAQARAVWLDRKWTVEEAISVYKFSTGLFSHEMHSPIMCIANGVPAIVVRWAEQSSKGTMWQTIGLGDWLFDFDNEADVQRYVPTVLHFATHYDEAKQRAEKARAFVNARQKETMEFIRTLIEK